MRFVFEGTATLTKEAAFALGTSAANGARMNAAVAATAAHLVIHIFIDLLVVFIYNGPTYGHAATETPARAGVDSL